MSDSVGIRRSSRRREPTKTVFQQGDIVEIRRSRGRKGRLVSKLKAKASASHLNRWLVAFDEESLSEEEMSESRFGVVVGKASQLSKSRATRSTTTNAGSKRVNGGRSKKSSGAAISPSTAKNQSWNDSSAKESPAVMVSSEDSNQPTNDNRNKKKRKGASTTSDDPNPEENQPSDSSETKNKAAAARAARSLRRQAMVEEEHSKRTLSHPASKKAKTDKDENLVKVPMLTGTLFIYRGARPRAEFVFKK